MINKELIDAYFNGELGTAEKENLLNQLSNNSELKQEFDLQSDIIEGLKNTRKAELKARLDNVAIGGSGTSAITLGKVAIVSLTIATGAFIYFNSIENTTPTESVVPKELNESFEDMIPTDNNALIASEESVVDKEVTTADEDIITANVEDKIVAKEPEINKPQLFEPIELEADNTDDIMPEGVANEDFAIISNIDIEIDNSKRKYSFHYQFKEGKLFLFGTFDKGLYEILEFNSTEGKILYLFYKGKYYGLNKDLTDITELSEIQDASLIQNLEKVRANIKN